MPAASLNANRDVKAFQKQYAQGKASEKEIKQFLVSLGFKVFNSTLEEDKFEDIDCWIGTTPVSIKTQHSALNYDVVRAYFELRQQLTADDTWEDSWYYTSKAEKYIIRQGQTLLLVDKQALMECIKDVGFDYVKTLSWQRRQYLGGTYRYKDAECGYIAVTKIPVEQTWQMP